ncbi:MAG: DUF3857 domain-containing protein [Deltaproteobacteria bacterium]|nr:DUF3857 domain-containing protein [Deltaproteobacteria bacterium]
MRAPICLALSLCLGACASSGAAGPVFERFSQETTPGADAYPVVGGLVLLDRGTLRFLHEAERRAPLARLRHHHRLKVLRPAVLAQRRIEVAVDPGSTVVGLIARIVTADNDVIDLGDPEEIRLADGRKGLAIALPVLTEGMVVEHTYDAYFGDPRFVPPWYFQARLPTRRSEYAVVAPPGFQIDVRFLEGGVPNVARAPERFDTEEGTRLSWSLADLPAVFDEPQMTSFQRDAPQVQVSFAGAQIGGHQWTGFASWDDVRRWFLEERVGDWSRLSPPQRAEAQRIAGDAPLEEQALKLLEVVARDLPWTAGPRPPLWRAEAPIAENTLLLKQGNGTSRGLLLAALLRAAGIDALPAFAADRRDALLLPDFPSVRQIDRIVAVIPRSQGALILDPSGLTASGDVPSPAVEGTRIITLGPDGAEVLSVPIPSPKDSRATISYDLRADAAGNAAGKVDVRLTGAQAGALRTLLIPTTPDRYAEILSEYLGQLGAALPIQDVTLADLSELRRPLLVRGSASIEGLIQDQGGGSAQIDLRKLVRAGGPRPVDRRRYPLALGAPFQSELAITVSLPDDHKLEASPAPLSQTFAAGVQELTIRAETPHRLGIRASIETHQLELAAVEYPALARLLEAVERAVSVPLPVSRPPPKTFSY